MVMLWTALLMFFLTGVNLIVLTQPDNLKPFHLGDNVALTCSIYPVVDNYIYWFKQAIGEPLETILHLYALDHDIQPQFYGRFQGDERFHVYRNDTLLLLTISNATTTDTGVYYCSARDFNHLTFGNGVFLMYKGVEIQNRYLTQQSKSNPVEPGDSVTLQCSIDTETCAGEHSVYWFRHGSGESHPGVIYTHGNRSDQCEKSTEAGSPTQSCVYSLPKRNLSLSDAGTYYCAVATCGEILFGKGTVIDFSGSDQGYHVNPLVLSLVISNIFSLIAIAIIFLRHKIRSEARKQHRNTSTPDSETLDVQQLNYAECSFPKRKMRANRQQKDNVVYSYVRYTDDHTKQTNYTDK